VSLVDEVIDAHGGLTRWRSSAAIRWRLSSGGLAFATKGQRHALADVMATVATTAQTVELEGRRWAYRFDSAIPRPNGLRWSTADIAAFAATALWTYVSLPFRLPDLDVEEHGRRLIVRFPPGLHTHSPTQVLHIDEHGLIRRHDYTALHFGRWAKASQTVGTYRQFDGLMVATRRRVHPQRWPHHPLLVWIDVHSCEAVPRSASS
jgi:hypothetical protein